MTHTFTRAFIATYKGYKIWTGLDNPKEKYLVQKDEYNDTPRVFDTQADAVQFVDIKTYQSEKKEARFYYSLMTLIVVLSILI